MSIYIMRLDDACPRLDTDRWERLEALLDKYGVRPLVGVIPDCQDTSMDRYPENPLFWQRVDRWKNKGWCIAMHGCTHVYSTDCGGVNLVNHRSEFAGEPLEVQEERSAAAWRSCALTVLSRRFSLPRRIPLTRTLSLP